MELSITKTSEWEGYEQTGSETNHRKRRRLNFTVPIHDISRNGDASILV